jgi:molybdate/tungstate transport system substrate-binding protein
MNRRTFLLAASAARLAARTALEVAYAGSMTSVMEGPIRRAAAAELDLDLQGRAQGASGLAQLIAGGSIRPDVFVSVTLSPIETVLRAGKAANPRRIARTEMVIAYSPQSRAASEFSAEPWWQVLERPGIRFGRTDPITDPQGRNIIFVLQLAAKFYGQPDLPQRILGPDLNARQIFTEPTVQARLQSGELDAASAYKVQPAAFGLPYVSLPEAINLASPSHRAEYQRVSLTLQGKTYHPEPLVYYAVALNGAPHPAEASRFVGWLQGYSTQEIFRHAGYDPPGGATA